jgi:hypothetical protein
MIMSAGVMCNRGLNLTWRDSGGSQLALLCRLKSEGLMVTQRTSDKEESDYCVIIYRLPNSFT